MLIEFAQYGMVDHDVRVESVDSARAVVEQVGNGIEQVLAVNRQVGALERVLANQQVGVLAGSPLSGSERGVKVHYHAGVGGQVGMTSHFLSLVVGLGLNHRFGNVAQLGRKAFQGIGGCRIVQFDQHHQARGALDLHIHRRTIARYLDRNAVAVLGEGPVVGVGWANANAQLIGHRAPAILTPAALHEPNLGTVQTDDQAFAQLTLGHGVNAGVDGFVRNNSPGVIRAHELECARDLQGQPTTFGQKVVHQAKEHGVTGQLGAFAAFEVTAPYLQTRGADVAHSWCVGYLSRSIRPSAKARQYMCNGRRRAVQHAGDVPSRALSYRHRHDRFSFFRGEFVVAFSHRGTLPVACCT